MPATGTVQGDPPLTRHGKTLFSTRTLATGIFWNGLGRGLPIIVALIATPFLLHRLGLERWALFTLALSLAGSFGILDFGIGAALTRALAERIGTPAEHEAAPIIVAALALLTLISLVGAVLGWIFMPWVMAHLFDVPPTLRAEATGAFRLLCLGGPLIVVNGALWGVMSAFQKFRLAILSNLPVSVLYYVGPAAVLSVSGGLGGVIAALVAARLLQAVITGAIVLRLVPALCDRPRIDLRLLRPLLRIGAWVTVSNVLWPLMLYIDRFIVGAILPLAAVSYYATSLDVVVRLMMVPLAIGAVLFPAAAASYRARPERTGALLRLSVLPTIAIVFPACVVLAGGSHTLLALWIGKSFAADSATILVVFTIGTFLSCVALLPGTLSDAVGRPEIGAAILLVQAVLFLPVIVLMTRHYGVTGAAVTWMLRALFNCAARIAACRLLGLAAASLVPRLLAVSVAGIAGLLACWLVEPWLLRLGVMAAVAAAVPALAAAMLLEAGERAQIGRMVRRFVPGATLAFATQGGAKTPCVQRE